MTRTARLQLLNDLNRPKSQRHVVHVKEPVTPYSRASKPVYSNPGYRPRRNQPNLLAELATVAAVMAVGILMACL